MCGSYQMVRNESPDNQIQDLLRKSDDQTSGKSQKAIASLGRVMDAISLKSMCMFSYKNLNLLVCCICHNYDIPVHSPARFFQDFSRNIFLYRKRLSIPITTLSTINRMIRSTISLSIWTVSSTILITNLDVISIIKTVVIINIAFFICGILYSTILQSWQ